MLKLFGGLFALIKALAAVVGLGEGAQKAVNAISKLTDELVDGIAENIEKYVSKAYAELFRMLIGKLRNNVIVSSLAVPGSDWAPFKFHDQRAEHKVAMLAGTAKRTTVDALFRSAVHVDFGGYTPNGWSNYAAHAQIVSPYSITRGLFGMGFSTGMFILLQGPYGGDLAVGVGTAVTG